LKASVYDVDNNFLLECSALHSREENAVFLSGDRSIVQKITDSGKDFLVRYTDATHGIMDYKCVYAGYEQEAVLYVVAFEIGDTIKTVQRRADLKMRTNLPIKITLLDAEDKIMTDQETAKAVQKSAILRDISAGGIMIDVDDPLDVNQRLMFPFDKGSSPIMVQAEILREQAQTGAFHRYGCKFYGLNNGKESIIREYVFRLEGSRNYRNL